jgi:hypothetical protein
MNFIRRAYVTRVGEDGEPMTRNPRRDNESECLEKTPTKSPRDPAPTTPSDRFPLDYWSNNRKKNNMDSRSPFRGGGGMQVHAVPDGERATVNGQQLPWAYEYAE